MLKFILATGLLGLAAGPALAHPGHLGLLAGHDHWVAGAAIATAILVGLWGALKGKDEAQSEAETETEDAQPETAA